MLKQTKKHTVYEVWNEWVAESVFIDHKPTKAEVRELFDLNWEVNKDTDNVGRFIKKFVHVYLLEHFYITDPKTYLIERGTDD